MIIEILLTVTGAVLILTGIIGCVVPVIPGPVLSFAALIILSAAGGFELYNPVLLAGLGAAAIASQLLDNIFPVLSSKKAGAGRAGIWGSIIGMIIGTFFPPLGVIAGAFLGALLGEVLFNRENKTPLKAAMGVFTGTLLGILIKLAVCGLIAGVFISGVKRLF